MSLYDLIIRNGTLVTAGGANRADIAVAGGLIVETAPEIVGSSREEIDAAGLHIFPGVIDAHVHCNEPGRTEWEGFATGTQAMAAGGTTLFFDMPLNSHPPTLDGSSFDLKLAAAQASSLVDFGLWGGLVPGNLDRLDELAERGVVGFKAFMSNSGIDDFPACDDLTLYEGMERAAKLGRIVAVHAENDAITTSLAKRALSFVASPKSNAQSPTHNPQSANSPLAVARNPQSGRGVRDYLQSRPVVAELEAIGRAILYARETGCALHIVHVSSGRGVEMVAEARLRGVDVSCETCPHYLALTEEDLERLGMSAAGAAKCAPPIRSQQEQDALWRGLSDGTLPMVASDHSPAPPSMKERENFFEVWGGISGCQSLLQVLLTDGYAMRNLPLMDIARVTSDYQARRFGVWPRKGRTEVGADADLVLVDVESSAVLQASDLLYRHKHSPYVGKKLRGRIVRTMVRGTTVYANGRVASDPVGRLVTPIKG